MSADSDKGVSCQTCKHFLKSGFRPSYGHCRRFPPVWIETDDTWAQPQVNILDYCGEHEESNG